jgi:hypothetical protein
MLELAHSRWFYTTYTFSNYVHEGCIKADK